MKSFALRNLKDTLKVAMELTRHPPIRFISIENNLILSIFISVVPFSHRNSSDVVSMRLVYTAATTHITFSTITESEKFPTFSQRKANGSSNVLHRHISS